MNRLDFFDDAKRIRIRQRKKVNFFVDYLFYSEVTDYHHLRYMVNSCLGIVICALLYYLGWKRLNFGEFHPVYAMIVKWAVIFSTTFAFATSPIFRCALICVLLGALGKNGMAPLTLMIMQNLSDGPVENIVDNYRLAAEIIICHLQLQAKIVSNRVAMFTGPLEELLEEQMEKGLHVLKKSTRLIRQLIAPFLSEIKEEQTSEDDMMDKTEKQLSILSQRKALGAGYIRDDEEGLTEDEMKNATNNQPRWTKFKTKIGKKIVERMAKRCKDIFSKGIDKCRELFAGVQKKCYDTLPVLINWFVCSKFNMESTCQDLDRHRNLLSFCQSADNRSTFSQSMEQDMKDVVNMTKEMEKEIKVNVHIIAVEAPRVEMEYSLQDISLMIKAGVRYTKTILASLKQIIMVAFVFTVYKLFSTAVSMIEKYNSDVNFNNSFISTPFWLIDQKRHEEGKFALLRLEKSEWKRWKLRKVFSKPTYEELYTARLPFCIWIVLTLITCVLLIVDWYIYDFLNQVVRSSEASIKMGTEETAEIVVLGQGVVADFMNKMIKINSTTEKDELVTNKHCLSYPRRPNIAKYVQAIIIPLLAQLFIQVVFSYFINRITINYFLPFMFPRRDRVRLIYLYNKIQFLRYQDRHEARARIRFAAKRWTILYDEEPWYAISWFKLRLLDSLFRTGQCLLCQTYMRPVKLQFCSHCPATFCRNCIEEMHGRCYACQVEAGEVTSIRTQYLVPSVEQNNEKFIDNINKAVSATETNQKWLTKK